MVQAAHEKGVIHRDLKPANIMMVHGTGPILMDFGLARREDGEESMRTRAGQQLGSPAYMPLEQFQGKAHRVGPRSDVYSLGVILFEVLAGRRPFEGNAYEIHVKLATTVAPVLSSIRRGVDPELDEICRKAMAREVEDRFGSMREMDQALDGFLKRQTARSTARSPVTEGSGAPETRPSAQPQVRQRDPALSRQPVPGAERTAGAPREVTSPSTGMVLIRIEPGEFLMGSPDSDKEAGAHEKPRHRVRITRPFYLGIYEVTQTEFEAVTGHNPSHFKANARNPVESVSWLDAVRFCNQLSERERLKPFYAISGESVQVPDWNETGYRLPTEAEWEYACRAGTTTRFSFGDHEASLGEYAWYDTNSGRRTHPVGEKRPNAFGLYDMHGNVWEWCWDWSSKDYYKESPVVNPRGSSQAPSQVIRGGCWNGYPRYVRASCRNGNAPGGRYGYLGFRVARVQSGG